jgi:hypothetical protein
MPHSFDGFVLKFIKIKYRVTGHQCTEIRVFIFQQIAHRATHARMIFSWVVLRPNILLPVACLFVWVCDKLNTKNNHLEL